jgi:UDP:flavonoid glycosyltransferase YjiC (YdhE family)
MRITLISVGTRGDVQPYVALGRGLLAAGYQVRLATHPQFEDFAAEHGLSFAPLHGNPQEILQGELAQTLMNGGHDTIRLLGMFVQLGREMMDQLHSDIWQAAQGSDALVYGPLAAASHYAAKKLGIPAIASLLQPIARSYRRPSIFMPRWLKLGIPFNYLSHLFVEQMLWQPSRSQVNRWLTEDLDMAPLAFRGPFREIYYESGPILMAFSPRVVPPAPDWPDNHHLTGYWFLDGQEEWQPPEALAAFLQAGPAPVYVGFGSMPAEDPAAAAETVLAALERSGQRGLLLQGWGGLAREDLPNSVHMLEAAPHSWLFPRMNAVVHHGGAGTTAAGLRAGVPGIIVPHFSDQPYWAERVHDLGVGPAPIPRSKLNVARLAKAIEAAQGSEMRAQAAALGEALRAEDGVGTAVALIQGHIEPNLRSS